MSEYVRKFFRMSDDELDARLCAHFEQGLKPPEHDRRQSGDRRALDRWAQGGEWPLRLKIQPNER